MEIISTHKQKTLAQDISYTGIGLHSGKPATVRLSPLPPDNGIVFIRADLPERTAIPAQADFVGATMRATTLTRDGQEVFTVEHLLSALYITDVDNCQIEMSGPEPPVGDGSALSFVELIKRAGVMEQDKARKTARIAEVLTVYDGERYVMVLPYDGQRFSFLSLTDQSGLEPQYMDIQIGRDDLVAQVAPARTIAFVNEIEGLKRMGLGLGGTPENVIVYDGDKALTPLRFTDELVRHKILDLLGDLFLAGRFTGHVIAVKSGHALNTALAKKIAEYIEKGESGPC